jgi:oxygen-dependent protoporphyrinogen oxidase
LLPVLAQAEVMHSCIPQYHVGHSQKVDNLSDDLRRLCPSLTLLGNSMKGIGVSDCVANAKLTAEEYAKSRVEAGDFLIGVHR